MTDKDKADIQNSGISNEAETTIQTPISTDDKTLLLSDALTVEAFDEPTHKFAAPAKETQTNHETEFENQPTKVLRDELQNDDLAEPPDENALRPSRLRFALVCLLFVFVAGVNIINLAESFFPTSYDPLLDSHSINDGNTIIVKTDPYLADQIKVGDEMVSFNNQPFKGSTIDLKIGEQYKLKLKREGEAELREVEISAPPLSLPQVLRLYFFSIILSAVFFFIGLTIFLFKPNDKQVLLIALLFALFSMRITPLDFYSLELPSLFYFWREAGDVLLKFYMPLMAHFFIVFPKRLNLVKRFPKIERLVYLPFLIILLPIILLRVFLFRIWSPTFSFDPALILIPFTITERSITFLYLFAALVLLVFNYLQADDTSKRRIRLLVVGFTFALFPILLALLISIFNPGRSEYPTDWQWLIKFTPWFLIPFTFAYAVLRHKVIPVSFIVRRGLQYLLAKNALRLLLILPVLGIVWNIAANPNRTLSEILLNNSFSFYFFVAVAIVDGLLMRSRLNEWIDRKFFREQYNQEKILRELTEDVKESDSLVKLSRLVSSRIQLALHPENIYLFFRDDEMNSDFSLGYTTDDASGNSANLKLTADSPLLRFMQNERGAVEFPSRQTDELPNREKNRLGEIKAELLVPMHGTDGKLAGIFLLGEKLSQIPYTGRDKELLETLANQIALVHENLNLKDQMRREQRIKTEVLARFDEGNINLLKECPKCGRCFDRDALKCADDNANLTFTLPVERTIENRYRLEKLLGKGGMGAVYKAADLRLNRTVALKIISGANFGNQDALRRFEREAQASARLNHRNIVTVFDYGTLSTEGAFLVMELVKGISFRQVFDQRGKLDLQTTIDWFGQVLDGVEAAHKAGIIHRDLKPDNILFRNEQGKAHLSILDFGLARFSLREATAGASVTAPGTVMGTLGYMPPEQLRGEKVDERSDLFAVGVMIYEALHGEKPFEGNSYMEIMQSMSREIELGKEEPLAEFLERSLALKPENRFASASEMKTDLLNLRFSD